MKEREMRKRKDMDKERQLCLMGIPTKDSMTLARGTAKEPTGLCSFILKGLCHDRV